MKSVKVTYEMGLPRLNFAAMFNQARAYRPMDPVKKQKEVLAMELKIRDAAWQAGKLNPLIGTHEYTTEPVWDHERTVIQ